MKRYIRVSFLITFLLTITIVLSASFALFSRESTNTTRESLRSTVTAIKISELPPQVDLNDFTQRLSGSGHNLRVTLIDYSGKVVSDSSANPSMMENHLNRPEIQGAIRDGYGENIRKSDTTGIKSIYVSVPLNNDLLIRLSLPLSSTFAFVSAMAPVTLLVCLMLFIFVYFFSTRFSRKLISPFHDISSMLGALVDGSFCEETLVSPTLPELTPALSNIRSLASKLRDNVSEIRTKKSELDNLLKTATDGIILLASDSAIISINDAAREILAAPRSATTFQGMCRNTDLVLQVQAALQDGSARVWELDLLDSKNRYFRVFINPAKDEGSVIGAVIFISDITEIIRLERMRSEFFANVSHELKSPLTSIKGFSELMSAGLITDAEKQHDYSSRIVHESNRLLELINDLLHLSELESIKANPHFFEYIDIEKIASDVCSLLEAQASLKNTSIEIIGSGKLYAECEPIREMLYNLVDNAIKYGKQNGHIVISICNTDAELLLSVEDDGTGIAPEHLPRIFERFYKADASRNRKLGSTGLGLAIVKHTAGRYHGKINVQSELGKYTKIEIKFPHNPE